jgi:hypothetical protein
MTTKPQTKFNAKRSAEAATRRTGIEHTIHEVEAGWVVTTPKTGTAGAEPAPQSLEDFTLEVAGFLETEGCGAVITTEDEARTMIADGHANGRPAARVAGDILAWLAETEAEAEEAAETANPGDTDANTATDDAVAREATAVADALDAAPTAPTRATLRTAAQAVLDAWTDETNRETDIIGALEGPMASLHAALAGRAPRTTAIAPRKPREGTKQEQVLAMLRREEGASGPQIAEATGWAAHSVRGFLAGLKKKGIKVEPLERVRQVGPGKEGARGSFSVYHIPG